MRFKVNSKVGGYIVLTLTILLIGGGTLINLRLSFQVILPKDDSPLVGLENPKNRSSSSSFIKPPPTTISQIHKTSKPYEEEEVVVALDSLSNTVDEEETDHGSQIVTLTPSVNQTQASAPAAVETASSSVIPSKFLSFMESSAISKIVEAWPDRGDIKPPRTFPPTNRTPIATWEDLLTVQPYLDILISNFTPEDDNMQRNPKYPNRKEIENPLTLLNIEIPLNYSIDAPMTSTIPWSNETTLAFYEGRLISGFRNQIMSFMILIFESQGASRSSRQVASYRKHHGQILLRSLGQKDTYGTNSFIPFAKLWDVTHWNSHYPRLPRLVDYDPILHSQFNYDNTKWYRTHEIVDKTTTSMTTDLQTGVIKPANDQFGTYGLFASPSPIRPYGFGYQHKLMAAYVHYGKGKGRYIGDVSSGHLRNPAEILMLQGAMRPHPDLQAILDGLLQNASLLEPGASSSVPSTTTTIQMENQSTLPPPLQLPYMTLHARVEPDMQHHVMCRDKKVINLTDIFRFIEEKWKDPPVSVIFMPINRQFLELDGDIYGNSTTGSNNGSSTIFQLTPNEKKRRTGKNKNTINWVAVENLKALNRARDEGLWDGRVKILEFGANALQGTPYAKTPSTAGAMLNFFLGIPAKIFIGTEVSSFSHDLLATRFFRGYKENYKYLPEGIVDWMPPPGTTNDPPAFQC